MKYPISAEFLKNSRETTDGPTGNATRRYVNGYAHVASFSKILKVSLLKNSQNGLIMVTVIEKNPISLFQGIVRIQFSELRIQMKNASLPGENDSEIVTERCTNCGKKVTMPCLACQVSRLKTMLGLEADRFEELGEAVISLELRNKELERYQKVRNHREKYGVPMFGEEHQKNE